MTSNHKPPQPSGADKPQVVVRAGKHFVCSACGTLVEIPADVVGQLVLAVDDSPQDQPAGESPVPEKSVEQKPTRPQTQKQSNLIKEPTPRQRVKRPQRAKFTGETIDGLRVPSAQELDRALAWVSFHLKVLDRQGSELKRLQKLLKNRQAVQVPSPGPRGSKETEATPKHDARGCRMKKRHVPEDISMAPRERSQVSDQAQQRGPPTNPVPSPLKGEG